MLARAAIIGFTIAAAVGPISLLVVRRTLADGWGTGMANGLGVATADGLYGAVAGFGLTAISGPLVALADPLGLVGGALLLALGVRTLLAPPVTRAATAPPTRRGLAGQWAAILGLTLANPMTILLFASVVVNLGLSGTGADAAVVTVGFFLGSLTWWAVLVTAVAVLRTKITGRVLHLVTMVSGAGIALAGATSIAAIVAGS